MNGQIHNNEFKFVHRKEEMQRLNEKQRRFFRWIFGVDHTKTWCWTKKNPSILCQEGICASCQIYKDWEKEHNGRVEGTSPPNQGIS